MHTRNRHQARYDFAELIRHCPALASYMINAPDGHATIDFASPQAVRLLNRALIASQYGIAHWQFPDGYLCPPIPGRADYVHGLADLLAQDNGGVIPRGPALCALDIGVGASAIYPLLGQVEYGWRFLGSEIDAQALHSARAIVAANALGALIELRPQMDKNRIWTGLLQPGEKLDLTLCNPPFHSSADEAAQGSARKWQNLAKGQVSRHGKPVERGSDAPALNFGGQAHELYCRGGEAAFVRQMVSESLALADSVCWFTSLIAKSGHLSALYAQLKRLGAQEVRTIDMAQGQKKSRFIAWTFLQPQQRAAWRQSRWA